MRAASYVFVACLALGVSADISCFQCTSNQNENCKLNDESVLSEFKQVCSPISDGELKGNNAIGCRKIKQSIEGVVSIVRECAYSGVPVDGLKKTGNHGIQLYYYQCENEQSGTPCNSIGTVFSPFSILTIIAIYLLH